MHVLCIKHREYISVKNWVSNHSLKIWLKNIAKCSTAKSCEKYSNNNSHLLAQIYSKKVFTIIINTHLTFKMLSNSILDWFPWILKCAISYTVQNSNEEVSDFEYKVFIDNNSLYMFHIHIDQHRECQAPIGADLFKTCLLLLLINTLSSECYITLNSWWIISCVLSYMQYWCLEHNNPEYYLIAQCLVHA